MCAICYTGNWKPPVCLSSTLIEEVVITRLRRDLNHYSKSLSQHTLYKEGILTLKTRVFPLRPSMEAGKPQLFSGPRRVSLALFTSHQYLPYKCLLSINYRLGTAVSTRSTAKLMFRCCHLPGRVQESTGRGREETFHFSV